LISYQFQFTKAHNHRILKSCNEHANETDGFEIRDITHFAFKFRNRDTEQIPCFCTTTVVCKFYRHLSLVSDEIGAGRHKWLQIYFILEVFFNFIQGVIAIQFLCIRVLSECIYELATVIGYRRVAMRVIDVFIPSQDTNLGCIIRRITIRFEIIG